MPKTYANPLLLIKDNVISLCLISDYNDIIYNTSKIILHIWSTKFYKLSNFTFVSGTKKTTYYQCEIKRKINNNLSIYLYVLKQWFLGFKNFQESQNNIYEKKFKL